MVGKFVSRDPVELRLAKRWRKEDKMPISQIVDLLGRHPKTVAKWLMLTKKTEVQKAGRPKAITPAMFKTLQRSVSTLQRKAGGQKEVTLAMVKAHSQCTASERTIAEKFHERGIWFYKLQEKPILTVDDIAARRAFAGKYKGKSKAQWVAKPHAIIDNKHFPLYLNKAGRDHAARRSVRGAFRDGAGALKSELVKPKGTLMFPAKSVQVTAAVIKGRIRMWHYCDGRWNAKAAATMYQGPLVKAMRKAYPVVAEQGRSKWVVLEDNDPAGYKSRAALAVKATKNIQTMDLPRRSPDLNVLDYSLWHAINLRMRKQEASFDKKKKETVDQYMKRLRHTALTLPTAVVTKAVGDMKRRVALLAASRGALIKE